MRTWTPIKNQEAEYRQFLTRAVIGGALATFALLAVLSRLLWLQVMHHDHFVTLSENNRLRIEPVAPTRGLIYDRNGVVLARNVPSYALTITPEQTPDIKATLARLGKIIHLRPVDIKNFQELRKTKRSFQPVVLRSDLSQDEVATFAVNRQRFPGVDIRAQLKREYPLGAVTAHVTGYVGSISQRDLKNVDPAQYSGTSEIGKIGVERAYESLLHGSVGERQVEVNAQGRIIRVLNTHPPTPGSDIYLSIDAHLQRIAYEALGTHRGAVVAIDPRNGEILAMVSKPGYDPNLFVGGISYKDYAELRDDPRQPLFNRVLRGQYPPGSTIKPFMGLAAMYYGVATPSRQVYCPGHYKLPDDPHIYHGWKRWGHGEVDLREAITESCDVYFYQIAVDLGIDHIHDFLAKFGFGEPTGVDLVGEVDGLNPSPAWKRGETGYPWYPGETVIVGIGQGYLLVTPLQLAAATATLAEQGQRYRPRILHAIGNPMTDATLPADPQPLPSVKLRNPHNWDVITSDMVNVVESIHGTAHRIDGSSFKIAGKTGTAQVYSIDPEDRLADGRKIPKSLWDHALFVAFAPAENPRIAVAVIVEHGGHGGSTASPIVRAVMDAYLGDEPVQLASK
ncbi:MAG TPA: penicillin-binding protein 2, partial [Gammaproteobacteria bacterium]|nr:penicillin-binding protein 2 [Gammaproteobacteria bacterium]